MNRRKNRRTLSPAGSTFEQRKDTNALLHDKQALDEILSRPVSSLMTGKRWGAQLAESTSRRLETIGIRTIGDLVEFTYEEFSRKRFTDSAGKSKELGRFAVMKLQIELSRIGLCFGIREEQLIRNLIRPVEELELSIRAGNILYNAGMRYVFQIVQKTKDDLLKTRNCGRKTVREIEDFLAFEMGLGLGMKFDKKTMARLKSLLPEEFEKPERAAGELPEGLNVPVIILEQPEDADKLARLVEEGRREFSIVQKIGKPKSIGAVNDLITLWEKALAKYNAGIQDPKKDNQ